MAAPVMVFVLVFMAYAMIVWRHREGDDEDGPPIFGHARIQATWITVTAVIVLSLAGFGTYELAGPGFAGAGAGEGRPRSGGRRAAPLAGSGHRPAVAVHLPVPAVRRVRDHGADAAGRPAGAVQRHLARRHPQLLGLPARGEGRRQPWRQQRRVHHAGRPARSSSAAPSCAACGTARCSTTATSSRCRRSRPGRTRRRRSWRRSPRSCRRTRPTYDPTVVPQINKAMAKAGIAGAQRLLLPAERPGAAVTRCSDTGFAADAAMKR